MPTVIRSGIGIGAVLDPLFGDNLLPVPNTTTEVGHPKFQHFSNEFQINRKINQEFFLRKVFYE